MLTMYKITFKDIQILYVDGRSLFGEVETTEAPSEENTTDERMNE